MVKGERQELKVNGGQSLFELVISIAISALIIVVLVSLVSNSIKNATFSKNNTLASRYAQSASEWLRGERDNDINTFMTNTLTPTWCLVDLSWAIPRPCQPEDVITDTAFIREVTFSSTAVSGKTVIEADITVSWEDAQGIHNVKSVNNFTDWRQR